MTGIILAAGYGTRLTKLSGGTSKCLIQLNRMCLIDHNIHLLEHFGITQVIIVVGHNAGCIREHMEGRFPGLRITYVIQEPPRGIADALRCALPEIGRAPFFMCLADEILISPTLENLKSAFQKPSVEGVCGIVKSTSDQITSAYTVDFDKEGKILAMKEKPHPEELYNDYCGTGYCLIRPALAEIAAQTPINQIRGEYEMVDWLTIGLERGLKLMAALVGEHSININTEGDFARAQALLEN